MLSSWRKADLVWELQPALYRSALLLSVSLKTIKMCVLTPWCNVCFISPVTFLCCVYFLLLGVFDTIIVPLGADPGSNPVYLINNRCWCLGKVIGDRSHGNCGRAAMWASRVGGGWQRAGVRGGRSCCCIKTKSQRAARFPLLVPAPCPCSSQSIDGVCVCKWKCIGGWELEMQRERITG